MRRLRNALAVLAFLSCGVSIGPPDGLGPVRGPADGTIADAPRQQPSPNEEERACG